MKISKKYNMLLNYGEKLQQDSGVMEKAKEFLNLFENQNGQIQAPSESSRFIISIYLAATDKCSFIDKGLAVRLSGLTKNAFDKLLNSHAAIVSRNINQRASSVESKTRDVSLQKLAVKFGCEDARPLAQKLMAQYREDHSKGDFEYGSFLPTPYYAIALLVALRKMQLPVEEKKMLKFISADKKMNVDYAMKAMTLCADKLGQQLVPESSQNNEEHQSRIRVTKLKNENSSLDVTNKKRKKVKLDKAKSGTDTEFGCENDCENSGPFNPVRTSLSVDYDPYYLGSGINSDLQVWQDYQQWKTMILEES